MGLADGVPRLPPPAHRLAARQARRLARHPAHHAGGDPARLRPRSQDGHLDPAQRLGRTSSTSTSPRATSSSPRSSSPSRSSWRRSTAGRRFGLATRAASENEVSGMLAGLSPNRLSMANTLLCVPDGGHARRARRPGHLGRPALAAPAGRARPRRGALCQLHLDRHRLRRRSRHRHGPEHPLLRLDA